MRGGTVPSRQSMANVVKSYKRCCRPHHSEQLQFYKTQESLSEAIEKAALAGLSNGKRHSHQRRIPGIVLLSAKDNLIRYSHDLAGCKSFSELHAKIDKIIGDIVGIGELTVYDTALRIGAYLALEPELIYLHAGVRHGVKALGLYHRLQTLKKSELPKEFHELKPHEIEDCLCIYKRELSGIAVKRKRGCGERTSNRRCG
jgi:hypothetical protein